MVLKETKSFAKTYGKFKSYYNLVSSICISIILFIVAYYLYNHANLLTKKTTAVYKKDCDSILTTGVDVMSSGSSTDESIGSSTDESTGSSAMEMYCNEVSYLEYTVENKTYKTKYTLPKDNDKPINIGDTLSIRYNPNDPSNITHNMISQNTFGKILFVVGCIIFTISIGQFIFCKKFPTVCGVGYLASNVSSALGGRGKYSKSSPMINIDL